LPPENVAGVMLAASVAAKREKGAGTNDCAWPGLGYGPVRPGLRAATTPQFKYSKYIDLVKTKKNCAKMIKSNEKSYQSKKIN